MEQELRFEPVGITEKEKFGPIMSNFLGRFFQVFMGNRVSTIPNPKSEFITNILTNQNNFCLFICFCLSLNNFHWLFWDWKFVNGFGESLNYI